MRGLKIYSVTQGDLAPKVTAHAVRLSSEQLESEK
jgi:hypothetical protein